MGKRQRRNQNMPMMITVQLRARGTTWSTGPQVSGGVAWMGALALRQRVLHSYRYKRPDQWKCCAPSDAANEDMARPCYLHSPDPVSAFCNRPGSALRIRNKEQGSSGC